MALLFFEKFSKYASVADLSSDNEDMTIASTSAPNAIQSGGRHGGNCLYMTTSLTCILANKLTSMTTPSSSTFVFGMAFKIGEYNATGNSQSVFELTTSSTTTYHIRIYVNQDGSISLIRPTLTLQARSAAGLVKPNTWHFLEVKMTLTDSGYGEVRLDGATVISGQSADFRTGTGTASELNRFRINNSSSVPLSLDFFYFLDGSGSRENDFLGDLRIEGAVADGDDATANWTASAGSNYQCVDDAIGAYNDDTDYISSSTSTQQNLETFAAISATDISGDPKFTMTEVLARNDGSNALKLLAKHSASTGNYTPAPSSLTTAYKWKQGFFPTNPSTAAAWTLSEVNAASFGVETV